MAMRYKFQHFMDIETSSSSLNIIKIMAGGEYVRKRCRHLFGTYKYWKLGKISVKLIPASTLPVDPMGLSLDDDDPYTVDPRDQMNPGLVRITNGEDTYSSFPSLETHWQDAMYKSTMMDPRWSKFMLQSGFRRTAYPLYWQIGQLHQDVYPGASVNIPVTSTDKSEAVSVDDTANIRYYYENGQLQSTTLTGSSRYTGLFQTGHRGKLGWMPTDAYEIFIAHLPDDTKNDDGQGITDGVPLLEPIPEIECITIILPRANKTKFYYRLFITEEVLFKGIKNIGLETQYDGLDYECRAMDNFVYTPYPQPIKPGYPVVVQKPNPITYNDGSGGQKP